MKTIDPRSPAPLDPNIVYYAVAYGSLTDGITFFGPFDHDNAGRFAEHISGTGFDSSVIPLTEARVMSAKHGFFPMGLHGYEVNAPPAKWPEGEELEEFLYVTLSNEFYDRFSELIAMTLKKAPPRRRDDLLAKLSDMSSVYGSDYARYMK